MTNRDILIHYALCAIAALAVGHYTHSILLGIGTFIAASALITLESQTRQRP